MAWRWVILLVIPIAVAAFVVRTVLVLALQRLAPNAAAFVDRWWPWVPLLVVLVLLFLVHPVVGIAATLGSWLFLTSSMAVGSPFRPRR